ncbi:helix-turn-helix domain-containing protein [Limobrevibacterium gyesilva]|uniref:Helix-turn-helix domain-containing protein n=1 Tax=Limobrevibacterium gyesilva TaxID=2991712 RepID=A0AA41YU82_9PROT|nr:helix-turn-helix domain-containing protein [Limobrevibacterium gyesilva]
MNGDRDADNIGPFGSSFDDFLSERGLLEETTEYAVKAVFSWQLNEARKAKGLTKREFAELLGTSRSQLDRILDPDNDAVTLETLRKAAQLLGKRVRLELTDAAMREAGPAEVPRRRRLRAA